MGTRGAVCLVVDGVEKTVYNHYDSYPDGLGLDVLSWLRSALADEKATASAVRALAPVPDREPTAADFEALAKFHDRQVSTGKDWYSLLRRTQGDLDKLLEAGYFESAADFPADSLFCEWAYVADFDARQFEIYEGFQKSNHAEGRFAGRTSRDPDVGYFPVRLVRSFAFDELPSDLSSLAPVDKDELDDGS